MKIMIKSVLAVVLLSLLCAVLYAAQATPPAPKYTEINYSADTYSYRWQGEDRVLSLTGNVKFIHGDTTVQADKVDYREITKTAVASGNLKITDLQNVIAGSKCTVNFKDRKATITGNVRIVSTPKRTAGKPNESKAIQDLRDEVVVTCDSVDYYYKEKKAVVSSPLKIVQKSRVVTADSAVYYSKDDILELVGNVKANDEKDKDSFSAPKAKISFKENDQWLQAEKAGGTIYVKEDELSAPSK